MKKIVAITNKNRQVSQCPRCANLQGLYDTRTKKTICYLCKLEIKN